MATPHERRVIAAELSLEGATTALIAYVDRLPEELATDPLPGGWTPAGHIAHVALTNNVFVGVIDGTGPLRPIEGVSDFSDDQWHLDAPPVGVVAPAILIPPTGISRSDANRELRESVLRLSSAIRSLDPAGATMCVRLPWNVVSLYQMAEWGGGHTIRHLRQVSRELQLAAMREVIRMS